MPFVAGLNPDGLSQPGGECERGLSPFPLGTPVRKPCVRELIWLLLVFYALAASMGTVWLWMTGARHLPAAQGGIFTVMLPISAALVGVLVLGETLSGLHVHAGNPDGSRPG